MRQRMLVITNKKLYLLEPKKKKVKEALPFEIIRSVTVSNRGDSLFVIKIPVTKKEKVSSLLCCCKPNVKLLSIRAI